MVRHGMDYAKWAAEHAAAWCDQWCSMVYGPDGDRLSLGDHERRDALVRLAKRLRGSPVHLAYGCVQELKMGGVDGCCALERGHGGEHRYQLTLEEMRFVVAGAEDVPSKPRCDAWCMLVDGKTKVRCQLELGHGGDAPSPQHVYPLTSNDIAAGREYAERDLQKIERLEAQLKGLMSWAETVVSGVEKRALASLEKQIGELEARVAKLEQPHLEQMHHEIIESEALLPDQCTAVSKSGRRCCFGLWHFGQHEARWEEPNNARATMRWGEPCIAVSGTAVCMKLLGHSGSHYSSESSRDGTSGNIFSW